MSTQTSPEVGSTTDSFASVQEVQRLRFVLSSTLAVSEYTARENVAYDDSQLWSYEATLAFLDDVHIFRGRKLHLADLTYFLARWVRSLHTYLNA